MRLVIANSALRASLAIYHLISNALSWNKCKKNSQLCYAFCTFSVAWQLMNSVYLLALMGNRSLPPDSQRETAMFIFAMVVREKARDDFRPFPDGVFFWLLWRSKITVWGQLCLICMEEFSTCWVVEGKNKLSTAAVHWRQRLRLFVHDQGDTFLLCIPFLFLLTNFRS